MLALMTLAFLSASPPAYAKIGSLTVGQSTKEQFLRAMKHHKSVQVVDSRIQATFSYCFVMLDLDNPPNQKRSLVTGVIIEDWKGRLGDNYPFKSFKGFCLNGLRYRESEAACLAELKRHGIALLVPTDVGLSTGTNSTSFSLELEFQDQGLTVIYISGSSS